MYNRSASSALRGLSRSRGLALRQFSTTPYYGVRAVFEETENTKLNKVFDEIQRTIIFPAHLPEKQRKIIFNPSKASFLKQNPITIELEGIEHNFVTIDRARDIRKTKSMLYEAIDLMETKRDWENLPTLLAGYQKAGIKLEANTIGKVSRKASFTDQISAILECAKQPIQTGFYIANKEQINHALMTINNKIDAAEGDVQLIQQSVKMADQILDIVQRPEHRNLFGNKAPRHQLQNSLTARGQILYARAALVQAKKDAGESVEDELLLLTDEIKHFFSLWAPFQEVELLAMSEFAELNPQAKTLKEDFSAKANSRPSSLSRRIYVKALARSIKAIEVTQQIAKEDVDVLLPLEAELKSLQQVAQRLEEHLQNFAEGDQLVNSAISYRSVMGRVPRWSGLPADLAEMEDVKKPAAMDETWQAEEAKDSKSAPVEEKLA